MSKGRQFTASSPNLGQAMVEKLLTQKDKQGESHKGNRQRKNGQKFGLLLLFCVGNGMEPEHIQHASSLFPAAPASNVQSDDYQRERELVLETGVGWRQNFVIGLAGTRKYIFYSHIHHCFLLCFVSSDRSSYCDSLLLYVYLQATI